LGWQYKHGYILPYVGVLPSEQEFFPYGTLTLFLFLQVVVWLANLSP